jgi:hypothetical protein
MPFCCASNMVSKEPDYILVRYDEVFGGCMPNWATFSRGALVSAVRTWVTSSTLILTTVVYCDRLPMSRVIYNALKSTIIKGVKWMSP